MLRTLLFSFVLLSLAAASQEVSQAEARFISEKFIASRKGWASEKEVAISHIRLETDASGAPLWYVVNLEPTGWMLVASRREVFPVLAYSYTGRHTGYGLPESYTSWMEQYARALSWIRQQPSGSLSADQAWQPGYNFIPARKDYTPVEPFVFSEWDQGWPYNEQCPPDAASGDGRCPTGCVPTAMAQIMFYYRWPETGEGTYTYDAGPYGILSADFGSTTYDWNSMGTSLTHSSPSAATLLSHLGISCDLVYGPNGSGMYNHKAAYSLRTYFKYSPETSYVFRDSTNLRWDSLLIAHLDRRMPLYYAGWSVPNVNGHAFVCDGYDDTAFFHFNFGWSGSYNGYFNINNLLVGGNNFNLGQEVIIHCYPDTNRFIYPPVQPATIAYELFEGSGSDGSAPHENYLPGTSRSWLISLQTEEDSIKSVELTFHRLDLGSEADVLTVYNGSDEQAPLLTTLAGSHEPVTVTGNGGNLYITFSANGNTPGHGFMFSYRAEQPVWCSGTKTYTTSEGELTDGSFDFQYYNKTRCISKIQPAGAETVTLFLDAFETESANDYLRILSLGTNEVLGEISGSYDPAALPGPFTAASGKMMLLFSTNDSIRADGFKAHWATNVAIDDRRAGAECRLWPNPCRESLHINLSQPAPMCTISISDLSGRVVIKQPIEADNRGFCEVNVSQLPAGVYQLEIRAGEAINRAKFVKF